MPYDPVLDLMGVSGHPGVYVLGTFAFRVTLCSQQIRAVNLVDAIHFYRRSLRGLRLAVVGGGAAGVTAAARAIERGAEVTLFEQTSTVLSVQSDSPHRWLHPSIYDWPFNAGEGDSANLPVMSWDAGPANEVAKALMGQWNQIKNSADRINTKVVGIDCKDGKVELRTRGGAGPEEFDAVIVAVGFGLEPAGPSLNSYWEQDGLAGRLREDVRTILIAGYGDGALTDAMRACLIQFDHAAVLKSALARLGQADLGRIRKIELDPRAQSTNGSRADRFLTESYSALDLPAVRAGLQLDPARRVFLTGSGEQSYSARASCLNRLVLSQLVRAGAVKVLPLPKGKKLVSPDPSDPEYAELQLRAAVNFDRAVFRFGSTRVVGDIAGLGDLKDMESQWNALPPKGDPTRIRLWEKFTPIESVQSACLLIPDGDGAYVQREVRNAVTWLKELGLVHRRLDAPDAIRTMEALRHTVRALCVAPVVLFELDSEMGRTNPVGMLLLGIRAAVRRGVTLILHRGVITPEKWNKVPFDLKELQIALLTNPGHDGPLIADAISGGLRMLTSDSSRYRDLPVYDIVRRPARLTPPLAAEEIEVFSLCSFSKEYSNEIWPRLVALLQAGDVLGGMVKLKRVIDYPSPLLAGERLYELIRFAGRCLVDWSNWSPNVFFEFEVRLAVHPTLPICVINERDSSVGADSPEGKLIRLLDPLQYPARDDDDERTAHFNNSLKGLLSPLDAADNPVYLAALRNVSLPQELELKDVEVEILERVERISEDLPQQGRLRIVYSENEVLSRRTLHSLADSLRAAKLIVEARISQGVCGLDAVRERIDKRLKVIQQVLDEVR